MPIQPPAGDSAVERVLSFLKMHQRDVLQYAYPPGQDWSDHENFVQVELATADIVTLVQQHQVMLSTLQALRVHQEVERLLTQDHV